MVDRPLWQQYITWSTAQSLAELVPNRKLIPEFPGFYAFNEDVGEIRPGSVFYVGETGRSGGLRARLSPYLTPNPDMVVPGHKGGALICHYRADVKSDHDIFLRWAPLEIDKEERREIEAAMIQFYTPLFNTRDREAFTSYDQ